MAQLLVRDVPPEVVESLKREAARHGRSAEAEHRALLVSAYGRGWDEFKKAAAQFRKETEGRSATPSEQLIRQGRDERDPGH